MHVDDHVWPLREPFKISRQVITEVRTVYVRLSDEEGRCGHGEAVGLDYAGETPVSMKRDLESVRSAVKAGAGRIDLLTLLPGGGARCALDAALWDLESKQGLGDPFKRCGVEATPVRSSITIGMRSPEEYEQTAAAHAGVRCIKIKVGSEDVLAAVLAVRKGAPAATLIVDPNQSWDISLLMALAEPLAELGVEMIEQPLPVGKEAALDGWSSPVLLCADESVNGIDDLDMIATRFGAINIKLDKAGGLTAAMQLADAAKSRDLGLMVGSMAGPSLTVAPAMVLAQRCRWADLDGPPLMVEDNPHGFEFLGDLIGEAYKPPLWG